MPYRSFAHPLRPAFSYRFEIIWEFVTVLSSNGAGAMDNVFNHVKIALGGVVCGALCMIIALMMIARLWPTNANLAHHTSLGHTQESAKAIAPCP